MIVRGEGIGYSKDATEISKRVHFVCRGNAKAHARINVALEQLLQKAHEKLQSVLDDPTFVQASHAIVPIPSSTTRNPPNTDGSKQDRRSRQAGQNGIHLAQSGKRSRSRSRSRQRRTQRKRDTADTAGSKPWVPPVEVANSEPRAATPSRPADAAGPKPWTPPPMDAQQPWIPPPGPPPGCFATARPPGNFGYPPHGPPGVFRPPVACPPQAPGFDVGQQWGSCPAPPVPPPRPPRPAFPAAGGATASSASASAGGVRVSSEDALSALPTRMSEEEESLADALFDFLAAWVRDHQDGTRAQLADLEDDSRVKRSKLNAFPSHVCFKAWIRKRLPDTVSIRGDVLRLLD